MNSFNCARNLFGDFSRYEDNLRSNEAQDFDGGFRTLSEEAKDGMEAQAIPEDARDGIPAKYIKIMAKLAEKQAFKRLEDLRVTYQHRVNEVGEENPYDPVLTTLRDFIIKTQEEITQSNGWDSSKRATTATKRQRLR